MGATDRFCPNCGTEVRITGPSAGPPDSEAQALGDRLARLTLGEFEIREELGRGGMAVVFLAHEISLGRKVAVKVLAPQLQAVPGMSTRFLREAQTAAGLEHPHIIPIYARRETPDLVFFTMRYVAGAPLSALLKQVGPLPIPLVRALLSDVGGALSFAHQFGVLHRDVKPGNVMVGRDGSVFVTDFGIAKQTDGPGLTLTGQLLGTPGYMSPEQCRGRDLSPASDQYSLGTMAFELLAGMQPFTGSNAMDVMAQQMTESPPDLRTLRADCPPELADAIARMLEKDPQRRFASIDAALVTARAAPLHPGDPVRTQLMHWVAGLSDAREFAVTPVSPVPRASDVIPHAAAGPRVAQIAPAAAKLVEPGSASTPHDASSAQGATPSAQPATALLERANRRLLPVLGAIAALIAVIAVLQFRSQPRAGAPEPIVPTPLPGMLVVSQLPPDGTIMVDGRVVSGPRLELEAGTEHTLRLEASGYTVLDTVVQLVAGTTQTVTFKGARTGPRPSPAAETTGTLVVRRLPPGGTISVDGRRATSTRLEMSVGRHTVRLEATNYAPFETQVVLETGKTSIVDFPGKQLVVQSPSPAPQTGPAPPRSGRGLLRLRVRPFANVYVDGRLTLENEEVLNQSLTSGRHQLRFERDGFVAGDTTIIIGEGDTLKVLFILQPKSQ